jgi:hypothetical protein
MHDWQDFCSYPVVLQCVSKWSARMLHLSHLQNWHTADLVPDGRYLVMDWNNISRVVSADGSTVEPSPSEVVALRSLLNMRFQRKSCWERSDAIDDEDKSEETFDESER